MMHQLLKIEPESSSHFQLTTRVWRRSKYPGGGGADCKDSPGRITVLLGRPSMEVKVSELLLAEWT